MPGFNSHYNRGLNIRCTVCAAPAVREPAVTRCALLGHYQPDPSATLSRLSLQHRIDQQLQPDSEHGAAYWVQYVGVHPDVLAHLRKTYSDWWERSEVTGE